MDISVYVVGYGSIDGLGNNPLESYHNILNEIDYTKDLDFMIEQDLKITKGIPVNNLDIKVPDSFSPKMLANMTRTEKMGLHVVDQALKMSNLPHSTNVAVIFSTVSNDTEFLEEVFPKILQNKRVNPFKVINRIPDMVSSHICSHYQFMGTSLSLFASCGTGLLSIDYAMRLCDEYDYVVVGSGDASVFRVAMKYFHAIGAIGNYNCPFDDKREGFVMGEGAGALILQSSEKVKEYQSKIYAKLYPVGSASDAYDLTSPANDGRGAKLAMTKALNYVERVDVVSAHATSTPIGDPIEYDAIVDKLGSIPIYAPKSKIGHTLGGAGILETIIAIESMRNGVIPHCHNLNTCSFDTQKSLIHEPKSITHDIIRTLNNSFGFGGKCASQVIEVNRNE